MGRDLPTWVFHWNPPSPSLGLTCLCSKAYRLRGREALYNEYNERSGLGVQGTGLVGTVASYNMHV